MSLHMTALDFLARGLFHDPMFRDWTWTSVIESSMRQTGLRIGISAAMMTKCSCPRACQYTSF